MGTFNNNNFFSFWHINIANSRLALLELFKDAVENKIDLISVNELYTYNGKIGNLPEGARAVYDDKDAKTALIILNQDFKVFKIHCDNTMVVMELEIKTENFLICSVYASPSKDINIEITKLLDFLSIYEKDQVIIMGDFNAKSPIWGKRPQDIRGEQVVQLIFNMDLELINNPDSLPTFEKGEKKSWIDLVMVKNLESDKVIDFKVERREISPDHNVISCILNSNKEVQEEDKDEKMNIRRIDWWKLKVGINKIVEKYKNKNLEEEVEMVIEGVQEDLVELLKKNMRKRRKKDKINQPWWNNSLRIARSKVQALRRRAQSEREEEKRKERFIEYKKEKAAYKKKLIKEKRESFKNYVGEINRDTVYGKLYRSITDKTKKKVILSKVIKEDGSFTSNKNETINNILDYHFRNSDTIVESRLKEIEEDFVEITLKEVQENLQKMKNKKAPGLDMIQNEVVKELFYSDKDFVLNIFNVCLKKGIYPKCWKKAEIRLILKEGKEGNNAKDFRPICLLSSWGKLFDRIITERLDYELESRAIIAQNQYGFRKGKSAVDALEKIRSKIEEYIEDNQVCLVLSLDFANAFNSVKWDAIRKEIEELNIKASLCNIILSFLNQRTAHLDGVDRIYSCGIPQGSSLGPKLWNIVINNLLRKDMDGAYIQAYADDIIIIFKDSASYKFNETLRNKLKEIEEWADSRGLKLNKEKCLFTMLQRRNKIITYTPRIPFGGKNLKYVKQLKYLGIIIDYKLNWIPHLEEIKMKVIKYVDKLRKINRATWGYDKGTLKFLYKTVVEKIIGYGAEVWYEEKRYMKEKLKSIQRIYLLLITKCYRTVATDTLNVLAGIIPIELELRNKKFKYHLWNKGIDGKLGEITFSAKDYMGMLKIERRQPWLENKVDWSYYEEEIHGNMENIFTDGSKKSEKVGCGIAHLVRTEIKSTENWRLSNHSNVYESEIMAIIKALDYADNMKLEEVNICTDSRSVLTALQSGNEKHKLLLEIFKRIKPNITFLWVKAHINILGNELADKEAKLGTERPEIDIVIQKNKTVLNRELKIIAKTEWQKLWEESSKGRHTFSLIPKVSTEKTYENFYENQILTNHGFWPTYQKRFFNKSEICYCGKEIGDIHHIIYKCELVRDYRKHLPKGLDKVPLRNLIKTKRNLAVLRKIVEYFCNIAFKDL